MASLTNRQKKLIDRFISVRLEFSLEQLLSYVIVNGMKFRKGGYSLRVILMKEIEDTELLFLKEDIIAYLKAERKLNANQA